MEDKKVNKNGVQLDAALEQSFFEKNAKKIAYVAIAIVVLIIAVVAYNYYSTSRNQKAAEALFPCEQYFQQGNFEKALNGDGQNCVGLIQVADQYGSTKSGNLAKLYAGISYFRTEKYEDAVKYLSDFDGVGDEVVSPMAIGALANSYCELGQNDKAVECLIEAAESADNAVLSPIYLIQAGEILESQNKQDEALELYQQIKDNYRGSVQGSEIDKYIERVNAK